MKMLAAIKRFFGMQPKQKRGLQGKYPQYEFGRGTYGDLQVHAWGEGATLKVGAFCSFAQGVQVFLGGEHRTDWVTTYPFNQLWKQAAHIQGHPRTKGDVIIGNDVWIASEAVILSGVKIGDGAVVAARSVVARDVPPYAIVAGNPARVVKQRFENSVVERLLRLKWWERDDVWIEKFLPRLLSEDVTGFLDAVEAQAGDPHEN